MNKQLHSTKSSTRTLNTRLKTKQIPSNFTINKNIPKKIPSINTHSTRPLTTTLLPDKIPHSLSNTPQLPHINPKHSLTPLNSLRSFSSQIQPPVSIPQYNTFVPTRLFGHGVDVAYIPRFVDTIQNFGDRFYKKALHVNEIDQIRGIDDINQKAKFLASRWAMKEALVKVCFFFTPFCCIFPLFCFLSCPFHTHIPHIPHRNHCIIPPY